MPTTNPTPKETITAAMARWAAGLRFEDLAVDAIYQAKRFLLDSFGCALGGYQQHDVQSPSKFSMKSRDEVSLPRSAPADASTLCPPRSLTR